MEQLDGLGEVPPVPARLSQLPALRSTVRARQSPATVQHLAEMWATKFDREGRSRIETATGSLTCLEHAGQLAHKGCQQSCRRPLTDLKLTASLLVDMHVTPAPLLDQDSAQEKQPSKLSAMLLAFICQPCTGAMRLTCAASASPRPAGCPKSCLVRTWPLSRRALCRSHCQTCGCTSSP